MRNGIRTKTEAFFCHRNILLIAVLLAFTIGLPTLGSGLFLDDYHHRVVMLTGEDVNLFDWYRTGTPRTDTMLQNGLLPWWTYPDSKLVFFRPIAEWLTKLDYLLWPENTVLMHLHSILWYVALVAATGFVYRRLMPAPLMVGLALIMFALDAGHSSAVAWLANRNSLVAMTGSMIALLCYMQGRWLWWSVGCAIFAITLGCAEAALAITGYFFSYEVFLSKRPWPQRVMRLAPYALVSFLWLGFWYRYGYGSTGPGIYTDPTTDPVGFLHNMIYRGPFLLFGQFTTLPVELLSAFDDSPLRPYILAGVLILGGLIAKFIWPVLKASPLAGFYALGMGIAIIPICGVQLFGRSLIYVSFGAIGLLAMFFASTLFASSLKQSSRKKVAAIFPVLMFVLHFAISPLLFLFTIWLFPTLDHVVDSRTLRLPHTGNGDKKILAISVNTYETNIFFPITRDKALSLGENPTRQASPISYIRVLAIGDEKFELVRQDENTLVVYANRGFGKMRKGRYGFDKDTVVALDDVTITVREVNAERAPTVIEYRFKPGALNTYEVIAWGGQHFVPAQLPAQGEKKLFDLEVKQKI